MITCATEGLSVKDEARIRAWLQDPAAELFLNCLKSEQAIEECQALASLSRNASEVCRGGDLPPSSLPHFKKAASLAVTISLFQDKLKERSSFQTAKLSLI